MIAIGKSVIPASVRDVCYPDAMQKAKDIAIQELVSKMRETSMINFRVTDMPDGTVEVEAYVITREL